MDWAKDITNIAVLFITVAALALVVSHAQGTATVIGAGTSGFNQLLATVENPGGSGSAGSSAPQQVSFAAFNPGAFG